MSALELVPMTVRDASAFVDQHHRHHPAPQGCLWAVGVARAGSVRRVAVLDDERNACSKLYGACWRAARALGYRRLVTYTLASEPGTSLVASGWTVVADRHPTQDKLRWEVRAPGWQP